MLMNRNITFFKNIGGGIKYFKNLNGRLKSITWLARIKTVKKSHKRPQDEPVFSGVQCANKVHTHQTELIQDCRICTFRRQLAIWLSIYADHEAFRLRLHSMIRMSLWTFFSPHHIYSVGLQLRQKLNGYVRERAQGWKGNFWRRNGLINGKCWVQRLKLTECFSSWLYVDEMFSLITNTLFHRRAKNILHSMKWLTAPDDSREKFVQIQFRNDRWDEECGS